MQLETPIKGISRGVLDKKNVAECIGAHCDAKFKLLWHC